MSAANNNADAAATAAGAAMADLTVSASALDGKISAALDMLLAAAGTAAGSDEQPTKDGDGMMKTIPRETSTYLKMNNNIVLVTKDRLAGIIVS